MGLDMYLEAEKYLSAYSPEDTEPREAIMKLFHGNTPKKIRFEAGYWRKANAIHQWFVNNCQGGKDECQDTYVSREKLQELLDLCKTVGKSKKKAAELLAPQGGFFFGSTDIDQYYFQDLKDTIEILEKCLTDKFFESCDFYYRSSW